MTKMVLVLAFLSQSPMVWAGEPGYFNGQAMEKVQALQMIGAPRTNENIERENQVRFAVNSNTIQLQHCYERALKQDESLEAEVIFYFSVSGDGSFREITADAISGPPSIIPSLISCSVGRIQTYKALKWNTDRTFRYRVPFSRAN